jgi:L-alanine-DL-glutamate epimerase-like enolase superfamily enzyme|tara:strand:+ start:90 stop:1064 length:975 start_codon:yes stop_codon:yes gene_type:complete
MKLTLIPQRWDMVAPFVTASETVNHIDVLHVTLEQNGYLGRAETMGVDYLDEIIESLQAELSALDPMAIDRLSHEAVQNLLPPGGSRNGLDCALWDLQAKQTTGGISALTGITLAPLNTLFTLSLDEPDAMARRAHEVPDLKRLKLKLNAQAPLDCLQAIREARPDAQLVIDANGSWTPELMMAVGDGLARFEVALLEQPLPRGQDAALENLRFPVSLCADESCQSSAELEAMADRYDAINIKLDKCGGLTDALAIREWCQRNKKLIMVGNMLGSSLAMAPALVVAQGADFVDLDGPMWQQSDVEPSLHIDRGCIQPPLSHLWG